MADYDSPWKEALDRYFAWFLAFFFPEVFELIDWSRDYEPLDTELRKIAPEAEQGKRFIDKLVKAYRRATGDVRLVHVEVQVTPEADFERRMHVYNYRIEDVYNSPVLTLVVLGDEDATWRPREYRHEEAGCARKLSFATVKLLDYANRLDELEKHENPFGLLVIAHLVAKQTREDVAVRKGWKLRLLRNIRERTMDVEDKRQCGRFLDWLLPLPKEDEAAVVEELEAAKEKPMPYVTSWERIGFDRGYSRGKEEGVLLAIESVLETKYAAEGLALMPAIREIHDLEVLAHLLDRVKHATTLDEVRAELARTASPKNGAQKTE